MSWTTLYIMSPLVIELLTFNTLIECHAAEQQLLSESWYTGFSTLCIEFQGDE